MLSDALNLKTEQIPKNRLWRHSISVDPLETPPQEIAELLEALIDGLLDWGEGELRAYVVVPEGSVDRGFLEAVEQAECPRFPIVGAFGASVGAVWRNLPFVFRLSDPRLLGAFAAKFWGRGTFAVYFSPLEDLEFFNVIRSFGLLRREEGALIWAPYWNPRSFEKLLTDLDAAGTDRIFRRIVYYLAESEEGKGVRVYCRGGDDSN
jgi:hypothetical protein